MASTSSTASQAESMLAHQRIRRRTLKSYMRAAWKLRMSVAGASILAVLVFIAVAAPLLTPYTPEEGRITERLHPPAWQEGGSWSHPLGTDGIGRDYATRLMYGARIALSVGLLATLVAGAIGIFLGVIAGYFGGFVDCIDIDSRECDDDLPFHSPRSRGHRSARRELHQRRHRSRRRLMADLYTGD